MKPFREPSSELRKYYALSSDAGWGIHPVDGSRVWMDRASLGPPTVCVTFPCHWDGAAALRLLNMRLFRRNGFSRGPFCLSFRFYISFSRRHLQLPPVQEFSRGQTPPFHGLSRGSHRGTLRLYCANSSPYRFSSVGSS
jgi:hypothetical protein